MAFHFTDLVFKVTNWTDTRFTHIEKAVLNALATRADEQGKCFPGFTCLVSDTGVSRGRLSDAIANITDLGLVEVEVGHRGKFRYALNEDAIITFGGLDQEEEEEGESKPKAKSMKGKNGHTYTRKADVVPQAPPPCETCGLSWLDCSCDEELEAATPPAETFLKLTCPKCEVTSLMTEEAYAKHISICTKAAPAPSLANPVAPKPTVVPPAPKPVEVPKVKCPMLHCECFGTQEQVDAHKDTFKHVCHWCKTAYHTKFECSACEDKCIGAAKVKRAEEEEAKWLAMEPWERRAKWEKDKLYGTRLGSRSYGRWQQGVEFGG